LTRIKAAALESFAAALESRATHLRSCSSPPRRVDLQTAFDDTIQGELVMYRSLFSRDLFAEFDRLQREMQQVFDPSPGIRGFGRGGYPALNVGGTPTSVDIYAFAPGLDPAGIDLNLDRGVLTIAGERKLGLPSGDEKTTVHANERFNGRFRRVVSLPDDVDPSSVTAKYTDGVLHVSIQRRASAQPRRIEVQ
jgi:HSP20 family protein